MEHKGIIYMATGIAIFAIMAAIIAFSARSGGVRTVFIDSFPSGAEVYLDGEKIGETPLSLNMEAFGKLGYSIGNFPLARIFNHELEYLELAAPEYSAGESPKKLRRGKLTFVTKPASASVPQVFGAAKPLSELGPRQRDIEMLMRLPSEDRIVAVFDKERLPPMDSERKMTADVTVFALPLQQPGVSMSEYKSCRVKNSSDFRKRK